MQENLSSGQTENQASGMDQMVEAVKDVVSYETHKKLLGEKKRVQEENAALKFQLGEVERIKREAEEKELAEKNEYKKLYESKSEEAKRLSDVLAQKEENEKAIKKISAVLQSLKPYGTIPADFIEMGVINPDSIIIDPSTGEVDSVSVQKEAERIRSKFPMILQKAGSGASMPVDAPMPNNNPLSYDSALQLKSSKEMAKAMSVILRSEVPK
jgi:hypothetical protein